MTKNTKGASKKATQRQGMPKVLETFSVVEESTVNASEEVVVSEKAVLEEDVWVNPPEVGMEPVDDYGGEVSEAVVPDVALPPLELSEAPAPEDVSTCPPEDDVTPEDVVEKTVSVVPGVEVSPSSVRRGGVSIRQLMAERASEASAALASALSDDKVGVKAALAARGVNGSKQSVKRTARARMHGGDALRGQNKCSTKVIG